MYVYVYNMQFLNDFCGENVIESTCCVVVKNQDLIHKSCIVKLEGQWCELRKAIGAAAPSGTF